MPRPQQDDKIRILLVDDHPVVRAGLNAMLQQDPELLVVGMAGDGKKLYFYGAGFEIEVYDATTFKYERTWDLNNDITSAGMIVIN